MSDQTHVCVIATSGWIFEGKTEDLSMRDRGGITLTDASVVRRWDNGRGIGGLADARYKHEYTLDAIGDIEVYQVIAVIPLRW